MTYKRSFGRRIVGQALPALKDLWGAYKRWRFSKMLNQFRAEFGLVVRNGPFKGIKYLPQSTGSALLPKLLGTYEADLHPVLASLSQHRYENVINIGCAEGYYAVGLAHYWPGMKIIAFDTNPDAREMCETLAELNGVSDRVTVLGECTPDTLLGLIQNRSLILCDCEGCEAVALDPALVEGLKRCDLIVELHPHIDAAIPQLFEARFGNSHHGVLIQDTHEREHFAELRTFYWFDRKLAMYEERGGDAALWTVLTAEPAALAVELSAEAKLGQNR